MRKVLKQALVPFSTEQMYGLVDDIESYPKYLPWCDSTEILSRNKEEVEATIRIAKGAMKQSFTTLNRLFPNTIEVTLIEGPFRHLYGQWQFESIDLEPSIKGCKVVFNLEFELSNRLLDMALGRVLENVTGNFLAAFCEEAEKRYGKK